MTSFFFAWTFLNFLARCAPSEFQYYEIVIFFFVKIQFLPEFLVCCSNYRLLRSRGEWETLLRRRLLCLDPEDSEDELDESDDEE